LIGISSTATCNGNGNELAFFLEVGIPSSSWKKSSIFVIIVVIISVLVVEYLLFFVCDILEKREKRGDER
jgi:hypothetical protein